MAEAWIIANPTATYRDAAMMHGVTHNSLRARITNKYGSLGAARIAGPDLVGRDPKRVLRAVRRCIRCGVSSSIDQGRRLCVCCHEEIAALENHVGDEHSFALVERWADQRLRKRQEGGA